MWREKNVVQAAYALNCPLTVAPVTGRGGTAAKQQTFLQVDAPNVIIEAVKKAEDDDSPTAA